MPLDTAGLQPDIEALASSPGETVAACATQWANAMGDYAASVVPASTTVSAATSALQTALAGAFASPAAAPGMESAFSAFAASVGLGMAPAFVATPPPGPVGFAAQFLVQPPTHAAAATAIAGLIDVWMRTGTATPSGGGPPVPWS